MKSKIATAAMATTLGLVMLTTAHAANDSVIPSSARELGEPLPATIQYLEQRSSRMPVDTRRTESPIPLSSTSLRARYWTPEQLQYWKQREAKVAEEIKNAPRSGRFDYIPRSNARADQSGIQ